ncbi:hypothetical protein KP509_05G026300 [Ceratopteris richardii]|uniref:Uncharacterized protein n=1 Tax=Ceratopteris richardii TaxID=49495 RepID=A0A8T2UMC7_CERRI|nr:hypothetical protein KP509_05G026300 [Ceratopteris richardii]
MISRLGKKNDGLVADNAPSGQVRVLVVGDSGVGKTSLIHYILHSKPILNARRTVGCSVEVKHIRYPSSTSSSSSAQIGTERDFFVELWDLSGHERYKDCRPLFYSQINGVIFVHDCSQRKTKVSLQKWAAEVAAHGTFSVPMVTFNAAGIPVPYLVIGNKVDIAPKNTGSSGNLVDVARHWVEKQGFLSPGDELPVTQSFPGNGGLDASAIEGHLALDAIQRFFIDLIRRKYFGVDNVKAPLPGWTSPPRSMGPYHSRGASLHDDELDDSYTSSNGQGVLHNPSIMPQETFLASGFPYHHHHPTGAGETHLIARSNSIAKSGGSSWLSDLDFR